MTSSAIELSDLVVRVGGNCVLTIERVRATTRCLLGLMGPNGAGKSTLLRVLLGLVRPAGGTVMVLGQEVGRLRGGALAALRSRIGYVPQLLPARNELPLTVREVVAIGRTGRAGLFHPLSRTDWLKVEAWMERLGIEALADRAFCELSGGEQRKTLLARAMAQEPELLLLDEPTANLDLGWRERMVEAIETLYTQTEVGVVLVCHELEVLPPSCREVLLLEDGRITAQGTPEALWTDERVTRMYGAGLQVIHNGGRHGVVPTGGYAGRSVAVGGGRRGGAHA